MNKFQLKKYYHKFPNNILIEVIPRRWKYIIKISLDGKISFLTSYITRKTIYFENLEPINALLKKLDIKNYNLAHNCPHTEIGGLDDQKNIQPQRNDSIKIDL